MSFRSIRHDILGVLARPDVQMVIGLIAIVIFGCLHQFFLTRENPDALYMDSLRLLAQLDQWENGSLSTLEFWGQGSSHRGFVNQLLLWVNVSLFDLDVLLANRFTGVVIACVALIITMAWVRDWRDAQASRHGLLAAGVSVTIAALCYSWAGFELLTLDLGLPLWIKNLCFLLYFCAHARLLAGQARPVGLWIAVLAMAAPCVVLVAGMGWNFAFAGAVTGAQLLAFLPRWRAPGRWAGMLPTISLMISMALYVASGKLTDGAVSGDALRIDVQTPLIALYALGSALGNPHAVVARLPEWSLMAAGGCIALAALLVSGLWLRRGAPGSRLPVYLMLYGVLVAISVTLARGAQGPWGVMASRYYMDLMLGLIGLIWMAAREAPHLRGRFAGTLLVWTMLAGVAVSQLYTYRYEWGATLFREHAFQGMRRAILQSVPDEEAATLLQSPMAHARDGVDVMRTRHLSVFADHPEFQCSGSDVRFGEGWHAAEAQGRWAGGTADITLPGSCNCAFVAELYIPDVFSPRRLEARRDGRIIAQTLLVPGETGGIELGAAGPTAHVTLTAYPAPDALPGDWGRADEPELGGLLTSFSVRCELGGQ